GDTRVRVRSMMELRQLQSQGSGVVAKFWNRVTGRLEPLEADGVVLATGYWRPKGHPLLKDLDPYLAVQENGAYKVGRYYRVESAAGFRPGVYLQGFCETTHGLSDSVLSVLPARSLEIVQSLIAEDRPPLLGAALDPRSTEEIEETADAAIAGAAYLPEPGGRI
ncbi:MAG TPA: hypothetical protein VMM92_16225, partial [Thermoanaerobaculia bacterium]|nr:hypothetical protein [Thermoanaerobaculia bacterium]